MAGYFIASRGNGKSRLTLNRFIFYCVCNSYPNKRVVYLALHGKERVKKKNLKRIIKWYSKKLKL